VSDSAEAVSEVVHVGPGQLFASNDGHLLRTVLGSCVSVCLWDFRLRIGGMNHFLLPTSPSMGERNTRHGDVAMDSLAGMLRDLGSSLRTLTAHVFGGARIFASPRSVAVDLGERNAEFAVEWLGEARIQVATLDVGGTAARRVEFSLADGLATVRKLGGH
jgi:chemotaxis protein CheD